MRAGFTANRREALTLAASAAALPMIGAGAQVADAAEAPQAAGRNIPFDDGWRFYKGTGNGFEQPSHDDSSWRHVDLPHDWSVEDQPGANGTDQIGPFDKSAVGGTAAGYTVGGEGWYRKRFRVSAYPADARIEVSFGGAYLESEVFLNGKALGRNLHGYSPFAFDLTPHLDRGGDNVLAVRVRNEGKNSRWYSGSGLYRQVSLDVLPTGARITRWGVGAWTRRLADGHAEIAVTTRLDAAEPDLSLITRLRDAAGKEVASATAPATVEVKQTLMCSGPRLWSPDDPNLYSLETELRRGATVVDRMSQPFGIRIVTFDPQRGMSINGKAIRLRGGCIHHDNGLLGACAFADADDRRIRLLKARGFNAIRSSHNAASETLRNACDRLGMLLIDEAFDAWFEGKEPQDFSAHFAEHWHEAIEAMVLPARNSPSVIMWSIGNEIPSRATEVGVEWEWKLANAVKRLDPTRPVTAGLNGVLGQEMIADAATARPGMAGKIDNASTIFLDVPGYNYRLEDVEREQRQHPERVVYASETFAREVFEYAALMERAPYFLGEFLWTAMDYIGEAGLGATAQIKKGGLPYYFAAWPWVNAWCGDLDLIGMQKAPSLARDVAWGLSPLEFTVQRPIPDDHSEFVANWGWPDELQSWTWEGHAGKPISVRLFTRGDRVELLLNGTKVAEKVPMKMRAEVMVPYAPGTLEAVAYEGTRIIARRKLVTADPAKRLRLSVERASPRRGRQALRFVQAEVLDAQGRLLPDDKRKVKLSVSGPAELIAFGSANPLAVGSLQAAETETFRGRALAILRSTGPGSVRVQVKSVGLETASTGTAMA